MEKVHHNDIQRKSQFLIFMSYRKELLLCLVTELALPEAKAIFRHHGGLAYKPHIGFFDFCRRITCNHKIIKLLRAFRFPFRSVHAKGNLANRRVIP